MTDAGAALSRISRGQWVAGALVLGLCALAWAWLVSLSGTGSALAMTDMGAMGHPAVALPPSAYVAAATPMWCVMMIAMMLPSALPMITAYVRHAREGGEAPGGTAMFATAYVSAWSLFAVIASIAQLALIRTGLINQTQLIVGNDRLAGLLMVAVGLYELSAAKFYFIEHCRAPNAFFVRFWQPGPAAALALGFRHALYCLGGSWLLMSLLFVGGAMSLPWAAGLATLVLVEKTAPYGRQIGLVAGVVILLTGIGLVFRVFGGI
jgi:predicted metal-binding membrane protein